MTATSLVKKNKKQTSKNITCFSTKAKVPDNCIISECTMLDANFNLALFRFIITEDGKIESIEDTDGQFHSRPLIKQSNPGHSIFKKSHRLYLYKTYGFNKKLS